MGWTGRGKLKGWRRKGSTANAGAFTAAIVNGAASIALQSSRLAEGEGRRFRGSEIGTGILGSRWPGRFWGSITPTGQIGILFLLVKERDSNLNLF